MQVRNISARMGASRRLQGGGPLPRPPKAPATRPRQAEGGGPEAARGKAATSAKRWFALFARSRRQLDSTGSANTPLRSTSSRNRPRRAQRQSCPLVSPCRCHLASLPLTGKGRLQLISAQFTRHTRGTPAGRGLPRTPPPEHPPAGLRSSTREWRRMGSSGGARRRCMGNRVWRKREARGTRAGASIVCTRLQKSIS